MADPKTTTPAPLPPALQALQDEVTRARLHKELAEHQSGRAKAMLPDFSGVNAPTDTLTEDKAGTGLSDVLVARAAIPLVDDLADLALTAIGQAKDGEGPVYVLVCGSPEVVGDCSSHRVLQSRLTALNDRVTAVLKPATQHSRQLAEPPKAQMAMAAPVLAQALPAALGLATKLLTRSYATSATVVTGLDRVPVDAGVAAKLRAKDAAVTVELSRVSLAAPSRLLGGLSALAALVSGSLTPALRAADIVLAETSAEAEQAQARLDEARSRVSALLAALTVEDGEQPAPLFAALLRERRREVSRQAELTRRQAELALLPAGADDRVTLESAVRALEEELSAVRTRLLELTKQLGGVDDTGGATPRREALDREMEVERDLPARLPALLAAVAQAQGTRDALAAVVEDATQLLFDAMSPGADGADPPLLGALRVDRLMDPDWRGFLVVARPLSGGVDVLTELKAGPDRRTLLAGIAVEWMVTDREGCLLDAGTRTALRSFTYSLGEPEKITETSVLYAHVPDVSGTPSPKRQGWKRS